MTRLEDAIRSLREDVDGTSPDADKTLKNILTASRVRPARTNIRLVSLLAAAFLLVGSVAWGAFAAWKRTHAGVSTSGAESLPTSALPGKPEGPGPLGTHPGVPAGDDVPDAAVADSARGPDPGASRPVDIAAPLSTDTIPTPRLSPSPAIAGSGQAASSEELAAYEKGHRAHFEERNAAVALTLWDDFLKRFPHSRWQPEVRYNRALCLIRLNRNDEARKALEPFARSYGGYRQNEASALLAALSDAGR